MAYASDEAELPRVQRALRWGVAGAAMIAAWCFAGWTQPLLALSSIDGLMLFDWLRGAGTVTAAGAAWWWIDSSRPASSSRFPWIAAGIFVTLWWFPIPLDEPHRAVYDRSVLRWPAGMWGAVWVMARVAVWVRRRPAWWKTRLSEVLLAGVALLLPLAGLEATYRWTLPTNAAGAEDLCTNTWLQLYDPNLSNPSQEFQFRDAPEAGPKAPGQRRVLFLGDSITYGWGVNREEDIMSRVTERLLQQRTGADVLTGNIAYFNRDTQQQRQMLVQNGLAWQPDVLVLVHDLSDISGEAGDVPSPLRRPGPLMEWLIRRSYLASRLYWSGAFGAGLSENHLDWLVKQYNDPQIGAQHLEALGRLLEECRRRDIRVLLVLSPFLSAVEHYPAGLREVHGRLASFGHDQGASVLDGLDLFAGTPPADWMVNRADRHPNAAAHRRYAEHIAEALLPLLAAESEQGRFDEVDK